MRCVHMILAASILTPAMVRVQAGDPARAAFTAQIRATYLDEYGKETHFLETFCRRSDGSFSHFGEDSDGGTFRLILDMVNRTSTAVTSSTQTVLVLPLSEREAHDYLDREAGSCTGLSDGSWTVRGQGTRLGLKVLEVEERHSGNHTTLLVVAPELNCFPLLDLLLEKGKLRTKKEVLSLEMGDPAPAAFTVPPGYAAVSPLQFQEIFRKKFGTDGLPEHLLRKLESDYQEAKAKGRLPR